MKKFTMIFVLTVFSQIIFLRLGFGQVIVCFTCEACNLLSEPPTDGCYEDVSIEGPMYARNKNGEPEYTILNCYKEAECNCYPWIQLYQMDSNFIRLLYSSLI